VKISAKTEYACLAMIELAGQHTTGEPVRIRTIAEAHDIPPRFLVQILLQLKSAGLVSSTRGASGGYQLARDPATISLGAIMSIIEGQEAGLSRDPNQVSPAQRALLSVWNDVIAIERQTLDQITLSDLLERLRSDDANMYFI
jgi:Rrf2 family protein